MVLKLRKSYMCFISFLLVYVSEFIWKNQYLRNLTKVFESSDLYENTRARLDPQIKIMARLE